MQTQIVEKIKSGFDCIKIKIGALDFETEIDLLKNIRKEFSEKDIEIRVDANCAFSFDNALEKLKHLSDFSLHSIEQPIETRQWENMAYLCENSPLDIALDEELIGLPNDDKDKMVSAINPKYIILKPSLIGGIKQSEEWISVAKKNKLQWWVTSALESNVGLNAISQWVFNKSLSMKQGLGTGQLFSNNILCSLYIKKGCLYYNPDTSWDLAFLKRF
jgi:L-alanine-DL-glutamate epimerase-like enolase superfamily enzyme